MPNMLTLRRLAAKSAPSPLHFRHELSSSDESPSETNGLGGEVGNPPNNVSCSGFMVAVG